MHHIRFAFCVIWGLLPSILSAQKHDYIWIIGDDNKAGDTIRGGSTIDFNYEPRRVHFTHRRLNVFTSNASISDSLGNLIAYSNGCDIAGKDDKILVNGADINLGEVHTKHCDEWDDGYIGGIQSALMLPQPDSSNTYYFFYKHVIYIKNENGTLIDLMIDQLRCAVIQSYQDGRQGEVLRKDVVVISDTLSYGPAILATKHANGKDWWILTHRRNGNTFYALKFTSKGIIDTIIQTIGTKTDPYGESLGQMVFSPDGSKLYRTSTYETILSYSFNRSTGQLSDFETIPFVYGNDPEGEVGCAVSPNGRYLYLGARRKLWQMDLQASNISASQTLVAEWDQFPSVIPTLFFQLQLGPDCKIYGTAGGDTRYYHVIHNPDNPGMDCNVEQRGLKFPAPCGASMPSFPNFRLGPLDRPSLPCSPVVSSSEPVPTPLPAVSVFPNPAREYVKITLNRSLPGPARWALFDALGRPVRARALAGEDRDWYQVDLEGLGAGVYFWEVRAVGSGGIIGNGKLVVQRD